MPDRQTEIFDPAPDFDRTEGDILHTPGNPVLERHYPAPASFPPPHTGEMVAVGPARVVANFSLACEPDGAVCIRIDGTRDLTAADAHQLARVLTETAEQVADTRQKAGFES